MGAGVCGNGDFIDFCSMFIRSGASTLFLAPTGGLELGGSGAGPAMLSAFRTESGRTDELAFDLSLDGDFPLFSILITFARRSAADGLVGDVVVVVVGGVVCKGGDDSGP